MKQAYAKTCFWACLHFIMEQSKGQLHCGHPVRTWCRHIIGLLAVRISSFASQLVEVLVSIMLPPGMCASEQGRCAVCQ